MEATDSANPSFLRACDICHNNFVGPSKTCSSCNHAIRVHAAKGFDALESYLSKQTAFQTYLSQKEDTADTDSDPTP